MVDISVNHVTVNYGFGDVLKDISFTIKLYPYLGRMARENQQF